MIRRINDIRNQMKPSSSRSLDLRILAAIKTVVIIEAMISNTRNEVGIFTPPIPAIYSFSFPRNHCMNRMDEQTRTMYLKIELKLK